MHRILFLDITRVIEILICKKGGIHDKNKTTNANEKEKSKRRRNGPLYFDEAFKIMFANPKYIEILTLLVSRILKVEYQEIEGKVELAPTTISNRTLGEIKSERDIVVSIKSNPEYKIIMELNIKKELYQNIVDRNLYYAFQMSGGLEESKRYEDMRIIFQVNFNNYFVDLENKLAIDLYELKNKYENVLSNKLKILNINIAECYQLWYNKSYKGKFEPYEEDLVLLCAAMMTKEKREFEECLKEVRTKTEIRKLMEVCCEDMTEDEMLWGRWYNKEEEEARILEGIKAEIARKAYQEQHQKGLQEGLQEGLQKGIQKGIQKGRKEGLLEGKKESLETVAKKMIKDNVGLSTISDYTGLSIDQLEQLKTK